MGGMDDPLDPIEIIDSQSEPEQSLMGGMAGPLGPFLPPFCWAAEAADIGGGPMQSEPEQSLMGGGGME